MEETKSENRALIIQIHNLNKILHESGAGDMNKQLVEVREKMSYLENCCYEVGDCRSC